MKKISLLCLTLNLYATSPTPAGSGAGVLSSSGNNSFTMTCNAGTNLMGLVSFLGQGTINSVKLDGSNMTLAASYTSGTYPLFGYIMPLGSSSGSHSIVINSTGQVISNWACYAGVNQSGQPESKTSGQHTTGSTQIGTITGVTATALLIGLYINDNGNVAGAGDGSNSTTVNLLRQQGPSGTNGYIQIFDSNNTIVTAGSNNFGIYSDSDKTSSQPLDGLLMSFGPVPAVSVIGFTMNGTIQGVIK